jgi:GT2 family glycosyltransferase
MNRLAISVIIPTHNRCASLRRTLDALSAQTVPPAQFEVLAIADGCHDDTQAMVSQYGAPLLLRLIAQPALGPAAARNRGAAEARAPLLLFLDDDVEPAPTLLAAHVAAHAGRPDHVALGPYPPPFRRGSFFQLEQDAWWQEHFRQLCEPGHRFSYQDLLSGNVSMPGSLFKRVGGFNPDPVFAAHEDHELGLRLQAVGAQFRCVPEASGQHHDSGDLDKALRRKRQEGRADAQLARCYPAITASLPLAWVGNNDPLVTRATRFSAFLARPLSEALVSRLRYSLDVLERGRLRSSWLRVYGLLQGYWYFRGVADELGSRQAWAEILRAGKAQLDRPQSMLELDLCQGLEAAAQRLDEWRPLAARIRYGPRVVGDIPYRPGLEPLRGVHLRPLLARDLAGPLLEALALEGKLPASPELSRTRLATAIKAVSPWLGPLVPGQIWMEQHHQWSRLEWELAQARATRQA